MTLCTTQWWCGPLYIVLLGVSPIAIMAVLLVPYFIQEAFMTLRAKYVSWKNRA